MRLFSSLFKATAATTTIASSTTTIASSTTTTSKMCSIDTDKLLGSMLGFYYGDALAMPVHWYYDRNQLIRDFGRITTYERPKDEFKNSIMSLSNTGGGGRGSDEGNIVGTVILHGKKKYWSRGAGYHYHHGMQAGENTLDALVSRILLQSLITTNGNIDINHYLQQYIQFMTTPGSHNDTYAGTCHRMFFSNQVNGLPTNQCADNDGHNVDAIDALMVVPTIVVAYHQRSEEERQQAIYNTIHAIRNVNKQTIVFANAYADMLLRVLRGQSIPEAAQQTGLLFRWNIAEEVERNNNNNKSNSNTDPMTACYIDSAFRALLYFAVKYGDNYSLLLLQSVNAGGENVARTSLLGALAGARFGNNNNNNRGEEVPREFVEGLLLREPLTNEINQLLLSLQQQQEQQEN